MASPTANSDDLSTQRSPPVILNFKAVNNGERTTEIKSADECSDISNNKKRFTKMNKKKLNELVVNQDALNINSAYLSSIEERKLGKFKRRACKNKLIQDNWISDTLPVNISIMDDNSKEMLKEKKYNELLEELTGIQ